MYIYPQGKGTVKGGHWLGIPVIWTLERIKYMKILKNSLVFATAFCAGVFAVSNVSVAQSETVTTYYYTDYDKNNNGILDSQEFPTYVYTRWDRNRDGFLSTDEWSANSARWYPKTISYQTYTYWDKDSDGKLDPAEFNTVVSTTNLYKVWDADANNVIDAQEYASATFSLYDSDKDGVLSKEEWMAASR